MRKLIFGFMVGVVLAGGLVSAAEKLYRLNAVETSADALKCAKDGGKGVMLLSLNPDGSIATQDGFGCIVEVKP